MKFADRSADALGQMDLAVNNAGVPQVLPLTPEHKHHPAPGRLAAMLAFAAGLLVAALGAGAVDEPARSQPTAERAAMGLIRFQPTAKQFEPPNRPDVSARDARDIEALYRRLIGALPAISSGSRSSMLPSGSIKQ